MEELPIPHPFNTELKPKSRGRRRAVTRLVRTLVLLPPCILIGLLGTLLLACPERGAKKK